MIAWLIGRGVSARLAPFIVYGGLILLVLLGLWMWGNSRYNAGVEDTDAKWVEAGRALQEQARQSAGRADASAAVRVERHNERVHQEKERIDEAEQSGASPLDVLFGG